MDLSASMPGRSWFHLLGLYKRFYCLLMHVPSLRSSSEMTWSFFFFFFVTKFMLMATFFDSLYSFQTLKKKFLGDEVHILIWEMVTYLQS